jgi:hypothetical protein
VLRLAVADAFSFAMSFCHVWDSIEAHRQAALNTALSWAFGSRNLCRWNTILRGSLGRAG